MFNIHIDTYAVMLLTGKPQTFSNNHFCGPLRQRASWMAFNTRFSNIAIYIHIIHERVSSVYTVKLRWTGQSCDCFDSLIEKKNQLLGKFNFF